MSTTAVMANAAATAANVRNALRIGSEVIVVMCILQVLVAVKEFHVVWSSPAIPGIGEVKPGAGLGRTAWRA